MSESSRLRTVVLPDYEPLFSRNRVIRGALWTSAALNLIGTAVILPPALGIGDSLLPLSAPRFYLAQIGFTIALFALVFAWLATQARINRALVAVGGFGKLGFFLLFVAYWLAGDLPTHAVLQASPDLALATVLLWWAASERPAPRPVISTIVV